MKREHYTIQIGKFGLQVGHEYWKEIFSELNSNFKRSHCQDKFSFFKESSCGKIVPRAILFDLEPRTLNKLQNSTFSKFYPSLNIVSDNRSTGGNWANGYIGADKNKENIENVIRKNIEESDQMPFFDIFHSLEGGTGSGSGSYILEMIKDEFLGKFVTSYPLIPNQKKISNTVIQPYNSILSIRWLTLYADSVVFFENSSIEKIISSHNKNVKLHMYQINSLIAKIITTIKMSEIYPELSKNNIETLFNTLTPVNGLHFFTAAVSNFSTKGKKDPLLTDQRGSSFSISNCTIPISFEDGKLISSFHILNRNPLQNNIYEHLKKSYKKSEMKFIEWAPPSIHYTNLFDFSKRKNFIEMCLYNHSSLKKIFEKVLSEYDCLKKRNAFLNDYLKEFNSENTFNLFQDARETVYSLIKNYAATDATFFP
ncbi:gamma-tubulin (nucleomorph) [Cryptomonas paramecium]|uniref:Gamma-tubulin n=1 Tax=Cryptomonas paramaecium TaxID=2898 RepID=F2HI24_9CRYP|nr:gamma-tubulin [Cryptomonas paramecium]AEA38970.1 gamma-tubulin [Cryptomonas paramecium]|mmetsp:Transcript_51907/g.135429  ORF Transcript_51907/g.135429 Transcript_51907/m.135429 type:complete len:426 (+) Transcript_51907:5196-6473(+)